MKIKMNNINTLKDISKEISLGVRISTIKNIKWYSQLEFAKMIGLHRSTLSMYENNRYIPKYSLLVKMALALEVPFTFFIQEPIEPEMMVKSLENFINSFAVMKLKERTECIKEINRKKPELLANFYNELTEFMR